MTYSRAALLAELERDEGLKLKPYRCTAGKLTIGIGRNLDDVGITTDEARVLLANDVERAEATLSAVIPFWRGLSDARQRALLNIALNLGQSRLAGFKGMIAAVADGDFDRAADEALDSLWARQVGARAERLAEMMRRG